MQKVNNKTKCLKKISQIYFFNKFSSNLARKLKTLNLTRKTLKLVNEDKKKS